MTDLLTPPEVATALRVSETTLKRWRSEGHGPQAYYLSPRTVRYRKSEVNDWLVAHGAGSDDDDRDQGVQDL